MYRILLFGLQPFSKTLRRKLGFKHDRYAIRDGFLSAPVNVVNEVNEGVCNNEVWQFA